MVLSLVLETKVNPTQNIEDHVDHPRELILPFVALFLRGLLGSLVSLVVQLGLRQHIKIWSFKRVNCLLSQGDDI
jgi:hypothetical protein